MSNAPVGVAAGADSKAARATKVIYIMSQPKSGSTILGVSLGNCERVFFAGELVSWLLTEGRPVLGGIERTRFWRDVREAVPGAEDLFGPRAFNLLERGQAVLHPTAAAERRELRPAYRAVTEALYRAVAERADSDWVVDSSHLPLRARELQAMGGVELFLVFMVRDVEAVVASHTKSLKRSQVFERRREFVETNARMWATYALSLDVFRRQSAAQRILVRHEDFVADPPGVLRSILDGAGIDAALPDFADLKTGVPLVGNPLLRSEQVALAPKPDAPYRASRAMRIAQGPWKSLVDRLEPAATRGGAREAR